MKSLILLQAALNIEDSMEYLRYNNIVIATDADVDGMHIRLLLITFFLQFFPELSRRPSAYFTNTAYLACETRKKPAIVIMQEERLRAMNN